MTIYLITNLINGKQYVGQTTQAAEKRFYRHLTGHSKNMIIGKAIKKHGAENFEMSVLENCDSIEALNEREEFYIQSLNTLIPNGYNVALGGNNRIMHEESKDKIRQKLKGVKKSEDHKRKVVEALSNLDPNFMDTIRAKRKCRPYSSSQRKNLSRKKRKTTEYLGVIVDGYSYRCEFYFKGERVSQSFSSAEGAGHFYDFLCIKYGMSPVNFPEDIWDEEKIQNLRNLPKKRKCQYFGVRFLIQSKKWTAFVWLNKKANYIGMFSSEEEAAIAVDNFLVDNGKPKRNFIDTTS